MSESENTSHLDRAGRIIGALGLICALLVLVPTAAMLVAEGDFQLVPIVYGMTQLFCSLLTLRIARLRYKALGIHSILGWPLALLSLVLGFLLFKNVPQANLVQPLQSGVFPIVRLWGALVCFGGGTLGALLLRKKDR